MGQCAPYFHCGSGFAHEVKTPGLIEFVGFIRDHELTRVFGDQTTHIYSNFEGFPLYFAALFGSVI